MVGAVKRKYIIAGAVMLLAATYALAADKKYYEFPDINNIKVTSKMLIYDTNSGSRTITGATLRNSGPQACTDIFDGTAGSAIYTGTIDPNTSVNSALAGTASASSYTGHQYPSTAIDGDRKGLNVGGYIQGWVDNTIGTFPDSLDITFPVAKTINQVNVFSLQDNYASPTEPTADMTFTLYGITAFDLQYWNGSTWVIIQSVTGNNKVWRSLNFPAVTTDKIRVVVNGAVDSYSRIVELEAYTPVAGLVTDVYINTLTGDVYRMDTLGVWTLKGNIKGVQGNAGTMAVGTVTTLAPASPATVVFTGPSTARIINFGIPKGDPGVPAAVDFPSVQTALGTANDGTITLLSSTATEHTRFAVKNSGASIVFGITDRGLITVQNTAGVQLWSFSPTASTLTLKTKSGRTIFKVMSSAAGGTLTL